MERRKLFAGLIVQIVCLTLSLQLFLNSVTSSPLLKAEDAVICESNRGPVLGLVPNPQDCNRFYYCVYAHPGSDRETVPQEEWCADAEDPEINDGRGRRLYYDFRKCRCEFNVRGCFDQFEDADDFFICTAPIHLSVNITA